MVSLIIFGLCAFTAALAANCSASADLCREYAASGKYEAAIEECTKQIYGDIQVKYLEYSYNNRGAAFSNKEQYDQAIADYNKAIALNPRYATAYYNRALAHAKKNNYKKSIADFDKAIELNPEYAAAIEGRGQVLIEMKQKEPTRVDKKKKTGEIRAESAADRIDVIAPDAGKASSQDQMPLSKQPVSKKYVVQLGAFRVENNAHALSSRFQGKGFDATVLKSNSINGETLHRVFIGSFESREDAAKLAAEIREKENMEAIVVLH